MWPETHDVDDEKLSDETVAPDDDGEMPPLPPLLQPDDGPIYARCS